MTVATKFKLMGWSLIWAVLANHIFNYAPAMREDSTAVAGALMVCFGIAINELKGKA